MEEAGKDKREAEQQLLARREQRTARVTQVEEDLASLERPPRPPPVVEHQAPGSCATATDDDGDEVCRRKEIARLESEMARLWGPLYRPPVRRPCFSVLPCCVT